MDKPNFYIDLEKDFPEFINSLENLGKVAKKTANLDEKTIQLVQLAAACAIGSEGAVHSHTRRALQAGATNNEIIGVCIALVSTIGFPKVAAAISWVRDIIK
ncbi:MAG: carboxymuconolactone decarboxylase family protein [Desulfurella sp.]|jgi:AhpD family alkylhydroperoxidase|uniref:Alkylhydroperoxidase AhpD family core domain-containing protein n=2 Tax=Desulfurella TaxID=33001 RepID=A0A1G6ME52_9BACT|nr:MULTISPECIES: carboxymuconolactone decarboxylase family protein [Desulfurella]PMP67786.1 MAG: carboxymuconolactone decarboxylase family protein [Desulfurella multipotens]PMP92640.1 MAG: carboxymuconolactone decarboxylase family protein [Desulfurella sp.]SDC53567.1 alkylhydroperoxidase AhpD family core domain-containing protein [Desulfurella multipotens]